jgi:hypothetical protein
MTIITTAINQMPMKYQGTPCSSDHHQLLTTVLQVGTLLLVVPPVSQLTPEKK